MSINLLTPDIWGNMFTIEDRWQEEIKKFDPNLYVVFNNKYKLFEIRHKIPCTNIDRRVTYIHNKFRFRRIDYDVIEELKKFDWTNIYKYKTAKELSDYYIDQEEYLEKQREKEIENRRQDVISDNMGSFKKMMEYFRSGATPQMLRSAKRELEKENIERSKRPIYHY